MILDLIYKRRALISKSLKIIKGETFDCTSSALKSSISIE
jgi:hypothetical protein